MYITKSIWSHVLALRLWTLKKAHRKSQPRLHISARKVNNKVKVKSCYNPLRLGTVIVLVSSGIDFVNTPRLYSDRATRYQFTLWFVPEGAQSAWTLQETTATQSYARDEARTSECLLDRQTP